MIEKQTRNQIKHLRIDNNMEFYGKEFNEFCKNEGIIRHNTVKHTSWQNGVVKRINRSLLERARYLLSSARLLKEF